MKTIFTKISKRMFYAILIILSVIFLVLAKISPSIFSDLFVNLAAGFIGSLVTIGFIDKYFSSQRELEKKGLTKFFNSELDDLITMYLLNLVQIFNVEIGAILSDLGHIVDSPKDIHLTLVVLIRKDLEKEDVKQWDRKFLMGMNKKFDEIKKRFSNLKEFYSYGVISDSKMKSLIELENLTKKPLFFSAFELEADSDELTESKIIQYDDLIKKEITDIINSIEDLVNNQ